MKIPKKIDELLKRRTRLAIQLSEVSDDLDKWLENKGFDLDESPLNDVTLSGVMIYVEPHTSEETVRQEIERK